MRFLTLFCLTFLLLAVTPAHAQDHQTFGVVEAYYSPNNAHELGVSWQRIIFAWNQIQPEPNSFNPGAVPDQHIDIGLEVVGLIKGTPHWASETGSLGAVPNGLDLPIDDPNNVFAQFVKQLVGHYAPRGIHHWIIWNEPDIRPNEGVVEFEGEVADYARLLKTAYLAARSVDPNAKIYIAGTTWWHDVNHYRTPYLSRLLSAIQKDPQARANNWFFDGISVHIYFTTDTVWDILTQNRNILRQFGLAQKSIWFNEFNASPRLDPEASVNASFAITLDQQADFIVQASATALAAGVERMAVYRLFDNDFSVGQDEPWGIVRHNGSRRPAFSAYQQVIQRFRGAQRIDRFASQPATLIKFTYPDRTLLVLWNNTFEGGEFHVEIRNPQGESIPITDAANNTWEHPITLTPRNTGLVTLEMPPAQRTEQDFVVVAGAVRIIEVQGTPASVTFVTSAGRRIPLG